MLDKIKEVYKTDTTLNNIHHSWGWSLPATDIDCLLVEYKYPNNPVAIVEYKHENWNRDFEKGPIKALSILSDKAKLPFFIVIWNNNPTITFKIFPMNDIAINKIQDYEIKYLYLRKEQSILEGDYIKFMEYLRGEK